MKCRVSTSSLDMMEGLTAQGDLFDQEEALEEGRIALTCLTNLEAAQAEDRTVPS